MMQKLRCTYTQLRKEPYAEMQIFSAFMEGEETAKKALQSPSG